MLRHLFYRLTRAIMLVFAVGVCAFFSYATVKLAEKLWLLHVAAPYGESPIELVGATGLAGALALLALESMRILSKKVLKGKCS